MENSLLFSNVRVRSYSEVSESVLMPDVVVNRHCRIKRAIIDRGTVLPEGTEVGIDPVADEKRGFRITAKGITLVTPDHFNQDLHRSR